MAIYTGSGFRCRMSLACMFRILPSSGADRDLDEAARVLKDHESRCRWPGVVPDRPAARPGNLDDRRTSLTLEGLDLAETPDEDAPTPVAVATRFSCRCRICGDRFAATGPRARFCPKAACQARRAVPVRAPR